MSQWKKPRKLVLELRKAGLSYSRIARETQVAVTTITRIAKGVTEIPHEKLEGVLQELYAKYLGD